MIRRSLFLAGIALIAAPIAAQTAPPFDPARLAKHVQTLGSDAFEGRGPATAGETKTVDYLTADKAAGLQPGGDLVDGSAVDPGSPACCAPSSSPLAQVSLTMRRRGRRL